MVASRREFLRTLGLATLGLAGGPWNNWDQTRPWPTNNHVWRARAYIEESFLEEISLEIISDALKFCSKFYARIGRFHRLPGVDLRFSPTRDARELQLEESVDSDIRILYANEDYIRSLPVHLLAYGLSGSERFVERSREQPELLLDQYACGGLYHPHMATPTITINTCGVKCTTRHRTTSLLLFMTCHEIGHSLGLAHVDDPNNLMCASPYMATVMRFRNVDWRLNREQIEDIDDFFWDRERRARDALGGEQLNGAMESVASD